jgi:hypothetical protein
MARLRVAPTPLTSAGHGKRIGELLVDTGEDLDVLGDRQLRKSRQLPLDGVERGRGGR